MARFNFGTKQAEKSFSENLDAPALGSIVGKLIQTGKAGSQDILTSILRSRTAQVFKRCHL